MVIKSRSWIKAMRLRTLPLSLAGILLGSALALDKGYWDSAIFILALCSTILFQIVSNLANDLGDGLKGTDNNERVGPQRTIQSGEISVKQMKAAVVFFSVLSLISASLLIYIGSQNLAIQAVYTYGILALACVFAAISYTMGKRAYGYYGYGDLFVFLFFGCVSVMGVYPFFTKSFSWELIWPAITVGLLSTAVLNLNNMRDRINDAAVQKNTLVVKMGATKAKIYHSLLLSIAILSWSIHLMKQTNPWLYLSLIPVFILLLHWLRVVKVKDEKQFDPELKVVALSTFALALITLLVTALTK